MRRILFLVLFVTIKVYSQTASIFIDATSEIGETNRSLLGNNIRVCEPQSYVLSPSFKNRMREITCGPIRWPGGNVSAIYNWKIEGEFRDTGSMQNGLNIMEIAKFCDSIGAELQIVVNWGTMNAQDAADLVEFCNGPITSEWGHIRDSLGHPEPFNVKFWEIGNELDCGHMWHYSWSAQNARKYFFGGSEERRGMLPSSPHGSIFKGDLFISDGTANQKFLIRFPDVAPASDSVRIGPDILNFELWIRVDDLNSVEAGNYYEMDYANSILKFGDGINGNIPPDNYKILCEYTTTNHDGYVAFVDSMKAIDPTIKIGACMHPNTSWGQDTLNYVFQRIDFDIMHYYQHEDTSSPHDYYFRIAGAKKLLNWLYSRRHFIDTNVDIYADSIGLGLTEWNWILWNETFESPVANATLASGIFAAEVLGNIISNSYELKLETANYFKAGGILESDNLGFISPDYIRRPAFYAFKMFSEYFGNILIERVTISDFYVWGNDTIPIITAYPSKNESGDTLYLIVVNKHDSLDYETTIQITGFEPAPTVLIHVLNGDSVYATNEYDSMSIIIMYSIISGVSDSFTYTFPAHSVTAMEFVSEDVVVEVTDLFALYQNYPNPFNPTTTILFSLPQREHVMLKVFDVLGREVATLVNGEVSPGEHSVVFNASNLASGVYYFRLTTSTFSQTKKLLLLRLRP